MVVLTRVDDRLIHGQVAFTWTRYSGATCIVVCDDEVAADDLQRLALELATPSGVKLSALNVAEARTALGQGFAKDKVLLLVRAPQTVLALVDFVPDIKSVNVGGMRHAAGKRLISKAVAVDDADVACFRELAGRGVELEVRQLPTESKVPLFSLIK